MTGGRPGRGPYASENRWIEMERRIARLEGRLDERIDNLHGVLADLARTQEALLRATIAAQIEVLRGITSDPHTHSTAIRPGRKDAAQ